MLEQGLIQTYDDIFTLKEGDLLTLPGFAEKKAQKIIASIEEVKKDVPLPRLIIGLSIPHVGEETAYLLEGHFDSLDELARTDEEELMRINGVGDIVARAIVEWFKDTKNRKLLTRLSKVLTIAGTAGGMTGGKLKGKIFVLTGGLSSLTRDEAKNKIRALGGHISSSVSKATDYVVAGEDPGLKFTVAHKLHVTVLSEEEFLSLLRKSA